MMMIKMGHGKNMNDEHDFDGLKKQKLRKNKYCTKVKLKKKLVMSFLNIKKI